MVNPEKNRETPKKKAKTTHTTGEDDKDDPLFFFNELLKGIGSLKSTSEAAPSLSDLVWSDMLKNEHNLITESTSSSRFTPPKKALSSLSQELALELTYTTQDNVNVRVESPEQQPNSSSIIESPEENYSTQALHVDHEFTTTVDTQVMDRAQNKNKISDLNVDAQLPNLKHHNTYDNDSREKTNELDDTVAEHEDEDVNPSAISATNSQEYNSIELRSDSGDLEQDQSVDTRDSLAAYGNDNANSNNTVKSSPSDSTDDNFYDAKENFTTTTSLSTTPERIDHDFQAEAIIFDVDQVEQAETSGGIAYGMDTVAQPNVSEDALLEANQEGQIETYENERSEVNKDEQHKAHLDMDESILQQFQLDVIEVEAYNLQRHAMEVEVDDLHQHVLDISEALEIFTPNRPLPESEGLSTKETSKSPDTNVIQDPTVSSFEQSDEIDGMAVESVESVDSVDTAKEGFDFNTDGLDQVNKLDKFNELFKMDEFDNLSDVDQVEELDDLIDEELIDTLSESDKIDEPVFRTEGAFGTDTAVSAYTNDPTDFTWDSGDAVIEEGDSVQAFEDDDMEVGEEDIQTQAIAALPLDDVPLLCLGANNEFIRTMPSLDLDFFSAGDDLSIWWYDAHDSKQEGVVFLFGKYFDTRNERYISCCVRVKNILRELYILPRKFKVDDEGNPTSEAVELRDVRQELQTMLQHKKISTYKMTICDKKYAFSIKQVPREATYIKLNYSYNDYEFLTSQSGKTFSRIFGANTPPLEHFLVDNEIMGPCWLKLNRPYPLVNDLSWCSLNLGLENPGDCSVVSDYQITPPLNVLSLSLQTKMNYLSQTNEIFAASFFICENVSIEILDHKEGWNGKRCTIIRPPVGTSYPQDACYVVEKEGPNSKHDIRLESTEFGLLSSLLAAIHVHDPDIIAGHNFFGGDLDVLLTRMKKLSVPHWHKLGRLKSKSDPRTSGNSDGSVSSTFYQRLHMRGRIVCDTFEASQDLIKSKSFHLSELAKTQLDIIRQDIKPQELDACFETGASILHLAKHCSLDAYLAFALMAKLQILPLSKQLTNLAGNLWSRSIHGARSERNEYLLLHTFHGKGFICPDKPIALKKRVFEFADEALELELPATGRSRNTHGKHPSFEGGLVLDPKIGLYDKYVLLLDFNSLYPSIMQEFNVCFTTMDLDGDREPEAPPSQDTMGILPGLVKMFVDRRKRVKHMMSNPGLSKAEKAQCQIEQMGLKLTANSMYGCLGSSHSRFFAKPLAAFITAKGRDILRKTVDMAEQANLDVIYGDTDSIMINTNETVFSKANKIGQDLKNRVNLRFKMLEIDIDGVFRRTLLLRKKKYAAKVVMKQANGLYKEELEVKGIDIVRRDGCDLSRSTSERVLQIVLANDPQEIIVDSIHEYMKTVAHKVHSSEVPVDDYIIRKQLTKSPEEYCTAKRHPHVIVAKDMRRSGIAVKAGDTIPYIYCKKTASDGDGREPRMPDDVHGGKAVIDKEWYLLRQVLPSVDRICMPLEGTDRDKLAKCLQNITSEPPSDADGIVEVDQVPVKLYNEDGSSSISELVEPEDHQRNCESLKFRCPSCNYTIAYSKSDNDTHGLTCLCGEALCSAIVHCQTLNSARRYIQKYYDSPYQCTVSSCGFQTREQLPIDNESCLQLGCVGRLVRQYSAQELYDQLSFLSETIKCISQHRQEEFTTTSDLLEEFMKHSAFRYIDVGSYMM